MFMNKLARSSGVKNSYVSHFCFIVLHGLKIKSPTEVRWGFLANNVRGCTKSNLGMPISAFYLYFKRFFNKIFKKQGLKPGFPDLYPIRIA
jgi:hypothetical protein